MPATVVSAWFSLNYNITKAKRMWKTFTINKNTQRVRRSGIFIGNFEHVIAGWGFAHS